MAHRTSVSAGLLVFAWLMASYVVIGRGQPIPSPSLSPAPLTAPTSRAPVTAATLFPRLTNSFTNRADNAVTQWNIATQWVLRTTNDTNVAARVLALENLVVWKALQANLLQADPANETAVAGYAAHLLLMNLYPHYFTQYDQLLMLQTAGISRAELDRAEDIAATQVVELLSSRLDDGSQTMGSFFPSTAPPGVFRDISSVGNYRAYSQYAKTAPLCLSRNESESLKDNFEAPYVYPSEAYNTEYTAIYLLGSLNSTTRSASQTETALFWSDAGSGVAAHWNQLAMTTLPGNSSLQSSAELLALLNLVIFDSVVTGYAIKYDILFWRPISAINIGDLVHPANLAWSPLLPTPNNPGSPATQTALAGAAEVVLQYFYGTDRFPFTLGSEYSLGPTTLSFRTYPTFSSAATEVTESRYLGGTEFKADSQAGRALGRQIAQLCLDRFASLSPGS